MINALVCKKQQVESMTMTSAPLKNIKYVSIQRYCYLLLFINLAMIKGDLILTL